MDEPMRRVAVGKLGPALLFGTLLALACGGDDITTPSVGRLEITTSTRGPDPDGDGYAISIDQDAEVAIGVNATLQSQNLEPGSHSVRLSGVASHCAVAGENPRQVSVAAGSTTTVAFTITCAATTGSIRVTASTTGPSLDPDGYTVTLNGTEQGSLAANGEVTLPGLAPGDYLVGLSGVAANCQTQGDNPRTITVTAGAIAAVAFGVACSAPLPDAGTLRVTATTTGPDPDADGYLLAVDGGTSQPVGVNATVTLDNVAAGNRSVELSGIAGNCSVETNPITVTVAAGGTATAAFVITCTETGAYQVTELDFSASKLNNLGHIAGAKDNHAVLWRDGVLTDLGTLGGTSSGAHGLNNHDAVVGRSTTATGEVHGFLWAGAMHDLGADFLPSGINDAGQMIGITASGQAVFRSGGTSTPMACSAGGMNNRGQVVGDWHNPPPETVFRETSACLWENGVVRELVSEPDPLLQVDEFYSFGSDINDQGVAVGTMGHTEYYTAGGFVSRNGIVEGLPKLGAPGNRLSDAKAINEAGVVVGQSSEEGYDDDIGVQPPLFPVVWKDGTVIKLSESEGSAQDINDRGQILGSNVLWTPSGTSAQMGAQASH